ncbi:MAG: hypothetical protein ACK4K1_07255 [Flavobacterium sp.]
MNTSLFFYFINSSTRRWGYLIAILILLSIPFIAMQFTSEVNWDVFDFGVALVFFSLLFAAMEGIILWKVSLKTKFISLLILLLAFMLLWAEMAVGIFNSPIAGS